jgi:hypothetical protein
MVWATKTNGMTGPFIRFTPTKGQTGTPPSLCRIFETTTRTRTCRLYFHCQLTAYKQRATDHTSGIVGTMPARPVLTAQTGTTDKTEYFVRASNTREFSARVCGAAGAMPHVCGNRFRGLISTCLWRSHGTRHCASMARNAATLRALSASSRVPRTRDTRQARSVRAVRIAM